MVAIVGIMVSWESGSCCGRCGHVCGSGGVCGRRVDGYVIKRVDELRTVEDE